MDDHLVNFSAMQGLDQILGFLTYKRSRAQCFSVGFTGNLIMPKVSLDAEIHNIITLVRLQAGQFRSCEYAMQKVQKQIPML